MKLVKDEFIKKYSDKFEDEDNKIEFLEDVSDSFEDESEELKGEIAKKEEEIAMLKQKYIDRFMKKEDVLEEKEEEKTEDETLEEKEVIDRISFMKFCCSDKIGKTVNSDNCSNQQKLLNKYETFLYDYFEIKKTTN